MSRSAELPGGGPVAARAAAPGRADEVKVIVTFRAPPGARELALLRGEGAAVRRVFRLIPAAAATVPAAALPALRASPLVARVERDGRLEAFDHGPDTGNAELERSWGVEHIGAGRIHADPAGNRGAGVRVAVIDTGIDQTHPDLAGRYRGGFDFFNGDADPFDDNGHGTHVAGIVAGTLDGAGVVGVAPEADLYALKILGPDGSGDYSGLIAALEWSAEPARGISVVNMSLGGSDPSQALQDAVAAAAGAGLTLVAAAGNVNPLDFYELWFGCAVKYPARYDQVIAVTYTGQADGLTGFSCTGPQVDLAAPGDAITSSVPTGVCDFCAPSGYAALTGTSMASPHVAGTVALVLAHGIADDGDGLLSDDVKAHLCSTASQGAYLSPTDPRYPNWYGCGVLDADRALLDQPPPLPPANQPPVAADDTAATDEDTPLTIAVLANDSDPDGDPLGVVAVTDPAAGSAAIGPDGTILYSPDPDAYGDDAFGYTISDPSGATASATVTVSVAAVNDPPQAGDVSAGTAYATPVTVALSGSDVESCQLTFEVVSAPSNGTLGAIGGQACTADAPNVDGATVTYTPAAGFSGADAFTYRVTDGDGASATAVVSIVVAPPPSLHVGDLDGSSAWAGRNWRATVTIAVHDASHAPLAGVTVYGTWSAGASGSGSCVTGATGTCAIVKSGIGRKKASVTFTVTGVSAAGYGYASAANHDPDGESSGTRIVIARP